MLPKLAVPCLLAILHFFALDELRVCFGSILLKSPFLLKTENSQDPSLVVGIVMLLRSESITPSRADRRSQRGRISKKRQRLLCRLCVICVGLPCPTHFGLPFIAAFSGRTGRSESAITGRDQRNRSRAREGKLKPKLSRLLPVGPPTQGSQAAA